MRSILRHAKHYLAFLLLLSTQSSLWLFLEDPRELLAISISRRFESVPATIARVHFVELIARVTWKADRNWHDRHAKVNKRIVYPTRCPRFCQCCVFASPPPPDLRFNASSFQVERACLREFFALSIHTPTHLRCQCRASKRILLSCARRWSIRDEES